MKYSSCPRCGNRTSVPEYAIGGNVTCNKCTSVYPGKLDLSDFKKDKILNLDIFFSNRIIGSFKVEQVIQAIKKGEFNNDYQFSIPGLKQPLSIDYLNLPGDTQATSNMPKGGNQVVSDSPPPLRMTVNSPDPVKEYHQNEKAKNQVTPNVPSIKKNPNIVDKVVEFDENLWRKALTRWKTLYKVNPILTIALFVIVMFFLAILYKLIDKIDTTSSSSFKNLASEINRAVNLADGTGLVNPSSHIEILNTNVGPIDTVLGFVSIFAEIKNKSSMSIDGAFVDCVLYTEEGKVVAKTVHPSVTMLPGEVRTAEFLFTLENYKKAARYKVQPTFAF